MKTLLKVVVFLCVAFIVLLAGGYFVVTSSWFQTPIVLSALQEEYGESSGIDRFKVGPGRLIIEGLYFDSGEGEVTVDSVDADFDFLALVFSNELRVRKILADGVVVDASRVVAVEVGAPGAQPAGEAGATARPSPRQEAEPFDIRELYAGDFMRDFEGIFSEQFAFPAFWLDHMDVSARLLLAGGREANARLQGGGMAPGVAGVVSVEVLWRDASPQAPVSEASLRGSLSVVQKEKSGLDAVRIEGALEVRRPGVVSAPRMDISLELAGQADREVYTFVVDTRGVAGQEQRIFENRKTFVYATKAIEGELTLDVSESDIEPFLVGVVLPDFKASGSATYRLDPGAETARVDARFSGEVSELQRIDPKLGNLGRLDWKAEADLAGRGPLVTLNGVHLSLAERNGSTPLLIAEIPEALTLDLSRATPQIAEGGARFLDASINELPVAWVSPFVPGVSLGGDTISYRFLGLRQGNSYSLRTVEPLVLKNVDVSTEQGPVVEGLDFTAEPGITIDPDMVAGEVRALDCKVGGRTLASGGLNFRTPSDYKDISVGIPAFELELPVAFALPALDMLAVPESGTLRLENFVTHLHLPESLMDLPEAEFNGRVAISELAPAGSDRTLGAFSVELADAKLTTLPEVGINGSPLRMRSNLGDSHVLLSLSGSKNAEGVFDFKAEIKGDRVVVDDLQLLAAAFTPVAEEAAEETADPDAPDAEPVWAAVRGTASLAVGEAVAGGKSISDIDVRAVVDADRVTLSKASLVYGGATADAKGELTFDAVLKEKPYGISGELAVPSANVASLIAGSAAGGAAFWEGSLNFDGHVSGRGANLARLFEDIQFEGKVLSEQGAFRPLSATGPATSLIAGGAGGLLQLGSRASGGNQAISTLSYIVETFTDVRYNQLDIQLKRGEDLDIQIEKFLVLSDDFYLNAIGKIPDNPRVSLVNQLLEAKMDIRAKPETKMAQALGMLNLLGETADENGYLMSDFQIEYGGTVGNPQNNFQDILHRAAVGLIRNPSNLINMFKGGAPQPESVEAEAVAAPVQQLDGDASAPAEGSAQEGSAQEAPAGEKPPAEAPAEEPSTEEVIIRGVFDIMNRL